MARYIEYEKLYNALHEAGGCDALKESWADGYDSGINEAIRLLDKISTADVVEVNDNIDKIRKMVIHGIYSVVLEKHYNISVFVNCKEKINSLFDNYENIKTDHPPEKCGDDMIYIGKPLVEVAKETDPDFRGGYSVYVLQNENDDTGKHIDTSWSVRAILRKHPEISDYKVKFENDFFGTTVLRVEKDGAG